MIVVCIVKAMLTSRHGYLDYSVDYLYLVEGFVLHSTQLHLDGFVRKVTDMRQRNHGQRGSPIS